MSLLKSMFCALLLAVVISSSAFAQFGYADKNYSSYESYVKDLLPKNDARKPLYEGSNLAATYEVKTILDGQVVLINGVMIPKILFPSGNPLNAPLKFRNSWNSLEVSLEQNSDVLTDWNHFLAFIDNPDTVAAMKNRIGNGRESQSAVTQLSLITSGRDSTSIPNVENITGPFSKGQLKVIYGIIEVPNYGNVFQVTLGSTGNFPKDFREQMDKAFPLTSLNAAAVKNVVFDSEILQYEGYVLKGVLKEAKSFPIIDNIYFGTFKKPFFIQLKEKNTFVVIDLEDKIFYEDWMTGWQKYSMASAISYNVLFPIGMYMHFTPLIGHAKIYNATTGELKGESDFTEEDDCEFHLAAGSSLRPYIIFPSKEEMYKKLLVNE